MPRDIADTLRAAIRTSGQSANQLAKATGIPQTTISGFLRGRDIGIARAAKLAAHLGMKLTKRG